MGEKAALLNNKRCASCAQKYRLKNPKDHPLYIDGRSRFPYPLEFRGRLKLEIRTRDGFECQNCYITEVNHKKKFGHVLHIHHIDYNKNNCKESNLITLCKTCNVKANFGRTKWKKYYKKKVRRLICGTRK